MAGRAACLSRRGEDTDAHAPAAVLVEAKIEKRIPTRLFIQSILRKGNLQSEVLIIMAGKIAAARRMFSFKPRGTPFRVGAPAQQLPTHRRTDHWRTAYCVPLTS